MAAANRGVAIAAALNFPLQHTRRGERPMGLLSFERGGGYLQEMMDGHGEEGKTFDLFASFNAEDGRMFSPALSRAEPPPSFGRDFSSSPSHESTSSQSLPPHAGFSRHLSAPESSAQYETSAPVSYGEAPSTLR